ncbi:MAG: CotH kinase family protein [Lachnospiraceae bacterium]|nr:CotH kinase family protein [Lachnospiraceae bacterium]
MSRAGKRIFFLFLFTFILMLFGLLPLRMAGEEWIRGDGTPLEEEVAFVAGFPDRKTDVRLSLDPKHPENEEYYAIFPSYTDTAGIYLKLFGSDQFVLMDVNGNAQVFKNGDRLPDIGTSEIWYADIRSESGELRAHGKLHFVRAYDIPSVFIRTESRGMEYIDEDKSHSEEGEISVRSENGSILYEGGIKSIKGHGNSTWKKAKKPYQITLRDKADLFGMGRARKWILLANYMDHSQIRNSITYDMARSIGNEFAPESVYVELYLNGRCNGLYQLTEKVEVDEERLNITDLQKENELANSKNPPSQHSVSYNGAGESFVMGTDQAQLPKDITGGYLIEHDYGWKYEEEPVRFSTEGGDTYVLSFPADAPIGEVEYVRGLFQELEDRIESGEALDGFIDLESFAERYALEELVQDEGAGITSSYYYKDADRVDPPHTCGPLLGL